MKIYEVDKMELRLFGEGIEPTERECGKDFIHLTDRVLFKTRRAADSYIRGTYEPTGEKIYIVSGMRAYTITEGEEIEEAIQKMFSTCKAYTDAGEVYIEMMKLFQRKMNILQDDLQMTDDDVKAALKAAGPTIQEGAYKIEKFDYVQIKKNKDKIIIEWLSDINAFEHNMFRPLQNGFKQNKNGVWEMRLQENNVDIFPDYIEITVYEKKMSSPIRYKLYKTDDSILNFHGIWEMRLQENNVDIFPDYIEITQNKEVIIMTERNGIFYKEETDVSVIKKISDIIRGCRDKYVIYGHNIGFQEITAGKNTITIDVNGESVKIPEGTKLRIVIVQIAREPDGWGYVFKFGYNKILNGKETDLLKEFLYLLETKLYHEIGDLKSDSPCTVEEIKKEEARIYEKLKENKETDENFFIWQKKRFLKRETVKKIHYINP